MAIFAMLSIGVVMLSVSTLQREARIIVDVEAQTYVEEGIEASRNIRDQDFLDLVTGSHGINLESDGWVFTGSSELIDGYFLRTIVVDDVYRDGNGDIVDSGGSLDLNTKKVTSTVTWTYKGVFPRSLSLTHYLTNWTAYDWLQTTCAEFNGGTHSNTVTQPSAVPPADNCVLNLAVVEEPGSFFVSVDIGEHGNDVVVEGDYVYVATHKNSEGLAVIDISDINNPVLLSSVDVGARGRYVNKYGEVLYVGVQKSNKGLGIVEVEDPNNPDFEASIDIGGYGNQVAVNGDTLYMGVENSSAGFVIYDISDREDPSFISSLNLGASVRDVELSGDYAYVTTDDTNGGFKIIDVSNSSSPSLVSSLDIGSNGNSLTLNLPFIYLGAEAASDSLKVIEVSDPNNPNLITSLDLGEEVEDLAQNGNYLYMTLDQVNPGMAVVNVTSPSSPSLSYSFDIGGKGTGVSLDGDEVYAGVDTANAGLVITGQADVSVASSGTYVSAVLDTGSADTRYNYLDWDQTEVPGSTTRLQVRTASTQGGLSSAQWVGPDGTAGSYFETSRTAIVPDAGASGTQFIQFVLYLTSDGFTTPSIESVTVNYTP